MTEQNWIAVDTYLSQLYIPLDPALDSARESSNEAGLDPINVSPLQGKFLHILA